MLEAERARDPVNELPETRVRVGDHADRVGIVELVEQIPKQRGLTRTHFAGNHHHAGLLRDAVFEHRKGARVAAPQIEIVRVWVQREGLFGEPKVGFVHSLDSASVWTPGYGTTTTSPGSSKMFCCRERP